MLPLTNDEAGLTRDATKRYVDWGGGARSERINLTADEIKARLAANAPDPHGDKLLQRMAHAGIDITMLCVVDNVDLGLSDEEILGNNRACAGIAAASQGKILALAGVDPRRKGAPDLFRCCVEEYGMRGLKWHPDAGYYPNSREAYAVLEVAQRLGTPLLTHTGPLPMAADRREQRRACYAQPIFLDDVTQDFPGLKVIAAHMGRLAWREWAQLAQFRRNLYGDLAMWQIFAVASYERFCRDLRDVLDIAGVDSVLFGSDGPSFTALIPNEQFLGILRDLPCKAPAGIRFTEEEIDAVLGGNARRVFAL